MLTQRQKDVYSYIVRATQASAGIAPTMDEIAAALGIGKSTVWKQINALEERGFIRRLRDRARAIEVVRSPLSDSLFGTAVFFKFDDDAKRLVPWMPAPITVAATDQTTEHARIE